MANILTAQEAATVLRCAVDDDAMLDLLPLIDAYLENASGRDWTADTPVYHSAKAAARMLLVKWHEDPGCMTSGGSLGFGFAAALVQLEALALRYHVFAGRSGAGPICLTGAHLGDTVSSVVGKVGASGSQAAAFETVITVEGYIQQISNSDLYGKWYQAHLVPPEAV